MFLTPASIEQDIALITRSMSLCSIIRYQHQRFWERQTEMAQQALAIDSVSPDGNTIPRSESVADHSWHMADTILIVGPRFPELNLGRCLMLAIIHDKLELWTGDTDPLGKHGDGKDTHAFNVDKKRLKEEQERQALNDYLLQLNDVSIPLQHDLITDAIELRTLESKFVKAWDRLQTLPYIIARKDGVMEDAHLVFSLSYLATSFDYFPPIKPYYDAFVNRLLQSIAARRGISLTTLKAQFRLYDLAI